MSPFTPESLIMLRIKRRYLAAYNIRFEGKCPQCGDTTLYTYQMPGQGILAGGHEACKFYCAVCDWAAAGVRRHKPMEQTS